MKNRPITTICFIAVTFLVTFVAPIFDSSLYGVQGHPTEWLSFLPNAPLRHLGASLLFSPFIHVNFEHLMINLFFFVPMAMIIERKRSGTFLLFSVSLIHFQVLLALFVLSSIFPLEGKAFLGLSHIIVGLFSFWSLTNKKYGLLFLALLIIGVGQWQSQNELTLLAHGLGLVFGVELFFLGRFQNKQRLHGTN